MKENRFTSGSVSKGMLVFVGPYILGMVLQNLYGAVDLLVVGQFATTADVSAVTVGSQVMSVATQLVIGLATGITVLVGRFFGAQQTDKLRQTVGTGILLFAGVAAVLVALLFLGNGTVIELLRTPPEAKAAAREYLWACTVGLFFIVGYNVISSIWMGLGDTRTPFLFVAVACVINIAGDVLLVWGLGMGALGAAIATTAAQAGSFAFALLYMKKKGLGFSFGRRDVRLHARRITGILKVGIPLAVQNVLVGLSFLFITAIINQISLAASAAAGVVEKNFGFLIMPATSFGAGVATIAAQNLGAGQPKRASRSMWTGVWMALIPSTLISIFCQFGGVWLARIFTTDAEVIALAADYLRSYSVDVIAVSFVFCMNGYFNSRGYAWFSMAHSLITTFAARIPLSWAFSRMDGASLYGIGWAAPLSSAMSLVLCAVFLVWLRRRDKKLPPPEA